MKSCSKCKITKPLYDFYKKKDAKDGYRVYCKDCCIKITREYTKNNHEELLIKGRNYYHLNKDILKESKKKYKERNKFRVRALSAKRKSDKIKRTPKWLTKSDWIEINWAYQIAYDRSKGSGVAWEVDHIVPLRGKNVSGLHVPWNLQILTHEENFKKRNKF